MAKKESTKKPTEHAQGPGFLGKLGSGIADFLMSFERKKKNSVEDYCPIAGVANEYTYFLDNTALVSIIKFNGATFLMGETERKNVVESLKDVLNTLLREDNCAIQMVFQRDRRQVRELMTKAYAPLKGKAKALHLDADTLIQDRIDAIIPQLSGMEVYLAIYTYPGRLVSKEAMKEFRAEQKENELPDFPVEGFDGIQIYQEPDVVMHRHDSSVRTLEGAIKRMRIDASKLNVHQAIAVARKMLFPENTHQDWKPRLPGDPMDVRIHQMDPHAGLHNIDAYTYPSIGRQIAGGSVARKANLDSVVQVGDRFVATQLVELTPTNPKPFEDLLEHIGDIHIPIRVSFTFFGGGDFFAQKISTKKGIAYLATMTYPPNKKISAAGVTLEKQIREEGRQACGMSIAVSTWADDRKTASERIKKVGRAMDAWGDMQTAPEVGDPFLAFTATLPGWSDNLRHTLLTTTDKLLRSLPLNMITSPWKEGIMFFKNKQGGVFPYAPLSSEQQTTNILTFAPPGGGKSVLISSMVLAAVLDPVLQGLPKIAAIDIGNSSKGVINLLREIAPPELKERFKHVEFELSERFGINVMDTRLGCYKPLTTEMGFLVNFLTLILTPVGQPKPIDNATQIATTLVKEAYTACYEDEPIMYVENQDKKVSAWLRDQRDFEVIPGQTTWWNVVDFAMSKKDSVIAGLAQRFAVPNLKMMPAFLQKSETLKTLFNDQKSMDTLSEARRLLLGFVQQYPSLCKPSSFNFQDTDVCIIDLNKVTQDTGPEGARRTAISYMVSRYLLGKDFLATRDILGEMPPKAAEHYRSQIMQLETVRKYLIYDEFHRTEGSLAVQRTVLDDMRNGRKFNLMVMLASQNFEDFSEDIVKQATVRFVMRVDSPDSARELVKKYAWSETVYQALIKDVRGAGPDGAVMLMHATGLKTDDASCTQVLTNIIGQTELAAYATTREDAALRDAILDLGIPYWDTVRLIGKMYPRGVKTIVEQSMRAKRSEVDTTAVVDEEEQIRGALGPMIRQITEAYSASKLKN